MPEVVGLNSPISNSKMILKLKARAKYCKLIMQWLEFITQKKSEYSSIKARSTRATGSLHRNFTLYRQ